jgi:molybdopterin molybdotransferase
MRTLRVCFNVPVDSVLSYEDARTTVEQQATIAAETKPAVERVALLASRGRVLADPLLADRDLPPFDRSTRDGYAVRSSDVARVPVTLKCTASVRAGDLFEAEIGPGECVEIMTGACVPGGADAVVMVEYSRRDGNSVEILREVRPEENIVRRGSEAQQREQLVPAGVRISFPQIAVAASIGTTELAVYRKPRIAVLSTGDEVVPIDATPGAVQIRNSNAFSLAAQIADAGGEPVLLPIAPDEPVRLRELIEQGLSHDLLLLSGGVSMGKFDLVENVLAELGATFFFTGAKIQPGKPIVFGQVRDKYFFGLPGNPVSTMVTFELFARVMVQGLAGVLPSPLLTVGARLTELVRTATGLTRFLPALLRPGQHVSDPPEVRLLAWKGSGDVVSIARSHAWLIVPPDRPELPAGELVSVLVR